MSGSRAAIRVQLLGPVRAWRGQRELALGGPRRRAVLGMLAMRANQPVSRSELIDGLWGEDLPASAVNSMHVYVAGLRQVLEPRRANRAPAQVLPASGPGYLLCLDPRLLDAAELNRHLAQVRWLGAGQLGAGHVGAGHVGAGHFRAGGLTAGALRVDDLEVGDLEAECRSLDAALGLWQGIPLAGIPGPWADTERIRLGELRLAATEHSIDVMLALGQHRAVVAQLTGLIHEHPLRERFREQLMLALYRCGRQADALTEFAAARRVLDTELGIGPGRGLRCLHQQILTADPALDEPADHAGHAALAGSSARPSRPEGHRVTAPAGRRG